MRQPPEIAVDVGKRLHERAQGPSSDPKSRVGLAATPTYLIQSGFRYALKMPFGSSMTLRNPGPSTTALMSFTKGLSRSSARTAMTPAPAEHRVVGRAEAHTAHRLPGGRAMEAHRRHPRATPPRGPTGSQRFCLTRIRSNFVTERQPARAGAAARSRALRHREARETQRCGRAEEEAGARAGPRLLRR